MDRQDAARSSGNEHSDSGITDDDALGGGGFTAEMHDGEAEADDLSGSTNGTGESHDGAQ
jgi:hypothetical protein